jgi:preprotein translocase subunit SecE
MATSQVETVGGGADRLKLVAAVVLLLAGLVAFYWLGKQGALMQWGALLAGVAAAIVVFLTAQTGRDLLAFGRDAWREVGKVVWPERREAVQMTAYVFGFVVIMALFLWLTDKTLEWTIFDLILGWRK